MALTPEQIAEMDKLTGLQPNSVARPASNRINELHQLRGQQGGLRGMLYKAGERTKEQMQPVRDSIRQTADVNNKLSKEYKPLAAGTQQALNTGAGAINALAELPVVRSVTRPIGNAFSKVIEGAQNLGGKAIYETAKVFNEKAFQERNEENDQTFADVQSAIGNLSTITGTAAGVKTAPTAIGKAAAVTGVDVIPDKVINYAKELPNKIKESRKIKDIANNVKTLEKIESSYAGLRKLDAKNRAYDKKPREEAARSGYLQGSVDENGVIRTIQEKGAVERMRSERIDPVEATVSEKLAEERRNIAAADVIKKLSETIKSSGVQGNELRQALATISGDIEGLMITARDMGAPAGTIPVSLLHDTKIAKGKSIDYTNLSSQEVGKARVRAFKELVEDNADFDVKKINQGLSDHYALDEYLRKLDGKRVEGGRLGKYGAKALGALAGTGIGTLFGPVGSAAGAYIGSEVGQAVRERSFKKTFGNTSEPFVQPVVKPKTDQLLLPEKSSRTNAIQKDAIPVMPSDSFGETVAPNVVPGKNAGKPMSSRRDNSEPTTGFDPLKMEVPRLPAGDYTTSNGRVYQPTVEQEAMFKDIEATQDIADNLPNIIDELNDMDAREAVEAVEEATAELSTSVSIIEEQLGEMVPEKMLYILRKQMKEGTFQDRDFNPRSGNKLKLNSKGYSQKTELTAKRNSILGALQEQGRMYGFDNWDQNADMANAAADMYERTRDAYLSQKSALDVLEHQLKKISSQSMSTKKPTSNTANNKTSNINISQYVPETTNSVNIQKKRLISDETYQAAKTRFDRNMKRLNSGIPVDQIKDFGIMSAYHIETGVLTAMELGEKLAKEGYKFTKEQIQNIFDVGKSHVDDQLRARGIKPFDIDQKVMRQLDKEDASILQNSAYALRSKEGLDEVGFQYLEPLLKKLDINIGLSPKSMATEIEKVLTGKRPFTGTMKTSGGAAKLDDLVSEAKKYRSADDFIDAISDERGARPKLFEQTELRDTWNKANPKDRIVSTSNTTKSTSNEVKQDLPEYSMSHRPNKMGGGHDIESEGAIPDFYEHPEWYRYSDDGTYDESIRAIMSIRNKPEKIITIYRASPKAEINKGDWITLSKKYAKQESMTENTPVHSFKVKAKDIQFAGDDINEFGYFPN